MDQILQKASQAAVEKTITPSGPSTGAENSPFQKQLDSILGQPGSNDIGNLMEFVDKAFGIEKNGGVNTVDASSVHVEVFGKEEAEKSKKSGKIDFATGQVDKTPGVGHLFEILKGINQDQLQFENLQEMFSSGKSFKPQELLAIQVGVGKMTVEIELLGKAMEAATKIPTQIVNMQVG